MAKSLNFVIVRATIICWCLGEHLVFGKYETNHNNSVYDIRDASAQTAHQFRESPRYSSGYSQHNFNPVFGTSSSKSRPGVGMLGVRSGTIKMKKIQDSSGQAMVCYFLPKYLLANVSLWTFRKSTFFDKPSQDSGHHLLYENEPHVNNPVMIMGGGVQPSQYFIPEEQSFDHFSNIDPKEAALKGFGLGLAIGLGALGGLAGLLKAILIPLLFLSGLLPFLLLLTAPIPVITMGKMFGVTKTRNEKGQAAMLQVSSLCKQKVCNLKLFAIFSGCN